MNENEKKYDEVDVEYVNGELVEENFLEGVNFKTGAIIAGIAVGTTLLVDKVIIPGGKKIFSGFVEGFKRGFNKEKCVDQNGNPVEVKTVKQKNK